QWWWLVLAVVVSVTMIAAAYSYTRTPVYTAQADVLVSPTLTSAIESDTSDQVNLPTEQRIASSAQVAALARDSLGTDQTIAWLLDRLSVTVPEEAQILEFSFSASAPAPASQGAQAFANAYLTFKAAQAQETIDSRREELEAQIIALKDRITTLVAELAATAPGSIAYDTLDQERADSLAALSGLRNQLATVSTLNTDPGQVIQDAQIPSGPSSPRHRLDLILGAFIGLLVGCILAITIERRRERSENTAWLEQLVDAPVLGMIPDMPRPYQPMGDPVTVSQPQSRPAEAVRTLRTNVLVGNGDAPALGSILVTSASPREGKTTIAASLAVATAQLGRDVVLVSADLREPRSDTFFGGSNSPGLTDVLAGRIALEDALQEPYARLAVLPSGVVDHIPDPVELLQSEAMIDVIRRAGKRGLVIVDGAPVLTVADSLVLSTMVDAVLFVANPRHGRRSTIAQARYLLRQVDANVTGSVLNRVHGWSPNRNVVPRRHGGNSRRRNADAAA
ncbi:MAG TPA: polysaccharide biosynthesis tyrosine autokinase, partial [Actinomycetota bacterium]|nr:polysaccharide biosynthesis tyrosine autokinase [Actinomycetota bacterium]